MVSAEGGIPCPGSCPRMHPQLEHTATPPPLAQPPQSRNTPRKVELSKRYSFLELVVGAVHAHLMFFRNGTDLLGRLESPINDALQIGEHLRAEKVLREVRYGTGLPGWPAIMARMPRRCRPWPHAGSHTSRGHDWLGRRHLGPQLAPSSTSTFQSERAHAPTRTRPHACEHPPIRPACHFAPPP
jgi:hypothetical protein